jgi:hypothetical protein
VIRRTHFALVAVSTLTSSAGAQSAPSFAASSYATGGPAVALAIGDWNRDGKPDVATAEGSSGTLSLLFGNGQGGLALPVTISLGLPAGIGPTSIAGGDFNGDGNPDIVCMIGPPYGQSGLQGVSVLLGNGSGGFASPIVTDGGPGFGDTVFAVADFDEDGKLDIARKHGATVRVQRGNGAGAFNPLVDLSFVSYVIDFAAVDLNHDGHTDIVAFIGDGFVHVRLGDGHGAFAVDQATPAGPYLATLAFGDFDLDGRLDLVQAGNENIVHRLLGNGAGGFVAAGQYAAGGLGVVGVAVGDLDLDGRPDVLTANYFSIDVSILMNVAPGFAPPVTVHVIGRPNAVAIADLNLDGKPDVITASGNGLVTVLLNQSPTPVGLVAFGTGTPGCTGEHGILANGIPHIGDSSFAIACTNAPSNAHGRLVIGNAASVAGFDPHGIGVLFHVDVVASTRLEQRSITSDASGIAFAPFPIPNVPALVGTTLYAQAFWSWPATAPCDPSPLLLSSSRGLAIAIQP